MIAVDAMGGDYAPHAVVEGALQASQQDIPIKLFGDAKIVIAILDSLNSRWRLLPITVVHCTETVGMAEEPSRAVLKKKDSSLVRSIQDVADGNCCAIVSAGNSGAILVASILLIERVNGILRPAIGGFVPTFSDSVFCVDLGANTDCKPEYLEQFALMGHVYVSIVKNIENPRIALLANGHESYKGSLVVKESYRRLQSAKLNFVGNIEARDIFNDSVDVIVCDGFSGNIMLKTAQGTAQLVMRWIRKEAKRSWISRFRLMVGSSIFKNLKNRVDYSQIGGALLLGVRKPVIIAHGGSGPHAIAQAITFANQSVQTNVVSKFNKKLVGMLSMRDKIASTVSKKVRSMFKWKQH